MTLLRYPGAWRNAIAPAAASLGKTADDLVRFILNGAIYGGAALVGAISISACASSNQMEVSQSVNSAIYDPLEPFNRQVFKVNAVLDDVVLEPLSKTYKRVTPRPARNSLRNFIDNSSSPALLANNLLQGDFQAAGVTLARFGINTTFGLGGLFDPASDDLPKPRNEDFGQTLGVWGLGNGPYLYLPVLGPSSVRDAVGRGVDSYASPFNLVEFDHEQAWRTRYAIANGLDTRASLIQVLDDIERNSLDQYAAQRSLYYGLRAEQTNNGKDDFADLPDFD